MITGIAGVVEGAGPDWMDVSVGGVTVRVHVPSSASDLGRPGHKIRLHTSLVVREDSLSLYGFTTPDARAAFETLLGVSGIGPRVALGVLSRMTPDSLARAVASGDIAAFDAVPGVGKKTAGRIILELTGKLDVLGPEVLAVAADHEVVEALVALGVGQAEARAAAAGAPGDGSTPLEERVRLALRHLVGV